MVGGETSYSLLLTLAPGAARSWSGLSGPSGETRLTDRPLMDALEAGAPLDDLLQVGTPRAGRDVRGVLDVLHRRNLLAWELRDADGSAVVTLAPLVHDVPLVEPGAPAGGDLHPSRFALLRHIDGAWLLESGRSLLGARLIDEAAAMVTGGEGPPELRQLLSAGGLLVDSDVDGPSRYWEFHDRYFASRSRRDVDLSGGTFRFAGEHAPEPFDGPPPHLAEVVRLPVSDPSDPGPDLWDVVERRRSHAEIPDTPVSLDALGSLLWHTLRVKELRPRYPGQARSYDVALRPVPSGGGTHSIGLWLACHNVEGLEPGVWWYDPAQHALARVCDITESLRLGNTAPVFGYLLSRHARLAWKYERIAHALALKDSGVILHALQLSATALGLTLCPVGSGPASVMLNAFGLDADDYVPVGEFWLAVAP